MMERCARIICSTSSVVADGGVAPLGAAPGLAQGATTTVFPTPEVAASALVEAIGARDAARTEARLGPEFAELLRSEGQEALNVDRQRFLEMAKRAMVIRPDGPDRATIEIGLVAWPVPVPLVRDAEGWRFDGAEGVEIVRDRVVGRNELKAIEVLRAFVDAQVLMRRRIATATTCSNTPSGSAARPARATASTGQPSRVRRPARSDPSSPLPV